MVSWGHMNVPHNWHETHYRNRSFGDRISDAISRLMGSWTFILVQTAFVVGWITLNVVGYLSHWDVFPFVLLNLLFSTQAAYTAPIIMMSQNRDAERDRHHAEADYRTNVEAKKEIEELQQRLSRIENEKLDRIISLLEKRG